MAHVVEPKSTKYGPKLLAHEFWAARAMGFHGFPRVSMGFWPKDTWVSMGFLDAILDDQQVFENKAVSTTWTLEQVTILKSNTPNPFHSPQSLIQVWFRTCWFHVHENHIKSWNAAQLLHATNTADWRPSAADPKMTLWACSVTKPWKLEYHFQLASLSTNQAGCAYAWRSQWSLPVKGGVAMATSSRWRTRGVGGGHDWWAQNAPVTIAPASNMVKHPTSKHKQLIHPPNSGGQEWLLVAIKSCDFWVSLPAVCESWRMIGLLTTTTGEWLS